VIVLDRRARHQVERVFLDRRVPRLGELVTDLHHVFGPADAPLVRGYPLGRDDRAVGIDGLELPHEATDVHDLVGAGCR